MNVGNAMHYMYYKNENIKKMNKYRDAAAAKKSEVGIRGNLYTSLQPHPVATLTSC